MIIENVLEENTFKSLRYILAQDSLWSKKPLTGCKDNKKFKNNKDYIGNRLEEEFKLMEAIQTNIQWRQYITAPKQSSNIFFLKYDKDSHYKLHVDTSKGFDGSIHFTNIFFISDPDEYEGGHLCLRINEEEFKYKPNKNSLLTYPTQTNHWVLPVIDGVRYVGIFWTESFITNEQDRFLVRELSKSYNTIRDFIEKNKEEKEHWINHELHSVIIGLESIAETIHQKYPRFRSPEISLISE